MHSYYKTELVNKWKSLIKGIEREKKMLKIKEMIFKNYPSLNRYKCKIRNAIKKLNL